MGPFLIRFFLAHPPAAAGLGVVALLGATGVGAWAYKRGKDVSPGRVGAQGACAPRYAAG